VKCVWKLIFQILGLSSPFVHSVSAKVLFPHTPTNLNLPTVIEDRFQFPHKNAIKKLFKLKRKYWKNAKLLANLNSYRSKHRLKIHWSATIDEAQNFSIFNQVNMCSTAEFIVKTHHAQTANTLYSSRK
jgi:hypothetical protein